MIVQAINNTAGTLTYSAIGLSVPGNSTVTIPTTALIAFATDPNVNSDILLGNLSISNSVTTYNGDGAVLFIRNAVTVLLFVNTIPSVGSITAQDTASTSTSMFNGQVFVTGTPTAGSFLNFPFVNSNTIKIQITGTWTGTLIPEVSLDGGVTWTSTGVHQTGTDYIITSLTNNAIFGINISGDTQFRIRSTTSWTGTATISAVISSSTNTVYLGNSVRLSDPTNQNQKLGIDSSGKLTSKINDGSGNAISSTSINSKQRLDVDLPSEGASGASAPFDTVQIGGKDLNGNLQALMTLPNGEQFVRDVLNVGSQYRAQSVTTSAAEALGAATILANRKLLHITPTNGTIYWGYSSGVTTATGTPLFPNNTLWLSVTDNVHVYLIAGATVDVRIGEVS